MGEFIKLAEASLQLYCTHPQVQKVWQIGYDARKYEDEPPLYRTKTCLLMKNGEQKEFIDLVEDFDKAEEYLKKLST